MRETPVHPDGETTDSPLSDLLTEEPVLLTFFTDHFSPDRIKEWCSFRDYDWFANSDTVQVVGVSKSRPFTHRKYIGYLDLQFPLDADTDLDLAEAYGVTYWAFRVIPRSRRSCFLLDTDGEVRYKRVADRPLNPSRDKPPIAERREAITEEFDGDGPATFGFD